MAPPRRRRTLAGYFDSARHEPYQLTWYHETEVAPPATFGLAIFRAQAAVGNANRLNEILDLLTAGGG